MTYEERIELNVLSKEVFGTTSRWRKLLEKGDYSDAIYSPQKLRTHRLASVTKVKSFTLESIKSFMLDLKAKTQERLEEIRKQNEKVSQTTSTPGDSRPVSAPKI